MVATFRISGAGQCSILRITDSQPVLVKTGAAGFRNFPLIVANPMLTVTGRAQHEGESEHTLDATAARVYLPIEFDFCRHDDKGGLPFLFI
jgi:hypothetical protein